jgi:hypothetical protein
MTFRELRKISVRKFLKIEHRETYAEWMSPSAYYTY